MVIFVSTMLGAIDASAETDGHEHHHAVMSVVADCPSAENPNDYGSDDKPCQEHSATLHCTSSPCCFQTDNGSFRPVAVGCVSQLRHRLDSGTAALSRRTVPLDRPPRSI